MILQMKKIVNKLGKKTLFFLIIGIIFIGLGLTLNFSVKKDSVVSTKKENLATGDYFSVRLNDTSIAKGSTAIITVKVADINVNSGDKGLGVISFKLNYDSSIFSGATFNSSVATITNNESTGEIIAVINNGNVITSTTDLMTISLTSISSTTASTAQVKLTNIKGSSGETISASDASGTVTFTTTPNTDPAVDSSIISFQENGNSTYNTGCGTKVVVDSENISSIKYIWVEGTTEPAVNEFQNTIQNNSIVSTGGVTGDYYLWVLVTLDSGQKLKARSNVFKLDNKNPTAPTITSDDSVSNEEVGHDVQLKISGGEALSGIKGYQYSFNNGASWNDYNVNTGIVITEEGITTVVARAISNTNKYSSASSKYIVNIKREEMVLTYKVSTLEKTNSDVTVRISSNTKLIVPNGWTSYSNGYGIYKVYSSNTVETVEITDENGNSDSITVNIDQIDKTAPECTVSYNTHDDYVEAVITSNEELKEKSGWNLSDDGLKLSKIYYHNTSENATVYDLAGNTVSVPISITGIEEGEFSVEVNYQVASDGKVTVKITSTEALKSIDGWTLSNDEKTLSKTYNGDVSENLTIYTKSNNKKNIALKYSIPDEDNKKDEETRVIYSKKEPTNESVIVTITSKKVLEELDGWELTDDGYSLTKVYSANTDETITVAFSDNTSTEVKIKITNIDKEKPVITTAVNNGVYESLKLVLSDDIESITIEKDGEKIDYEENMILTSKGSYIITLVDKAGNKSVYNIVISNDASIIEVPNTKVGYTKVLILIGILEVLVGLLYIFKFKVDNKINLAVVLLLLTLSRFNSSVAADSSALTINGYTVKNGNIYNIEATTTQANLKENLFDDSSASITKNSSSNYVATGDQVKYKSTTYNIIIGGDVDKDGLVTTTDTNKMKNHLVSKTLVTDTNSKNAFDYNNDGTQDISDLYLVNKRVVKNNYTIAPKGIVATAPTTAIEAGHTGTITAKVYPVNAANKTLSYKVTSGGSYSSVSGNTITGTKAGSSTVRVSVGSIYKDVSYSVSNCYKLHVIKFASADAMILEANGHYGMIDTGVPGSTQENGKSTGYNRIDSYLQSIMNGSRKKLDFIILTHNHGDHVGNTIDIINNYGTSALYAKRYSSNDDSSNTDSLDLMYENIIDAAAAKSVTINEYGISENSLQISGRNTNSSKTVIGLDAFTIKIHNISDEMTACEAWGNTSENLNSLTQSITITTNGKTMRTYLEGDLTKSSYKRSIPSSVKSNGHLSEKTKASVKAIVMWQAYDYLGLKSNNLDVYKTSHHGFYNGTYYNEIQTLKPVNIFVTSSQNTIYNKSNGNKNLCSVYAAKKYLGSKFSTKFKTIDSSIIYDYSSGSVTVSGGAAWNESSYPFTSNVIDTTLSACGTLDIE